MVPSLLDSGHTTRGTPENKKDSALLHSESFNQHTNVNNNGKKYPAQKNAIKRNSPGIGIAVFLGVVRFHGLNEFLRCSTGDRPG